MIFQTFDPTDVVAGRVQSVSSGMWLNGEPKQMAFFTSSLQAAITGSSPYDPLNGLYYLNIYDANPSSSLTAEVYFSVAYGHVAASGSSNFDLDTNTGSLIKPTQAIYSQYRNFLLTPGDDLFSFSSGSIDSSIAVDSPDIYVLNFASSKVEDNLDAGQFELTLRGSNGTFTFIDDSLYNTSLLTTTGGQRFNIVSGSVVSGVYTAETVYRAIGAMYPALGIVVLNPSAVSRIVGTVNGLSLDTPPTHPGSYSLMHQRLYESIKQGGSITSRVTEYVPARHYFVRIKNQDFNYSNNPTFVISTSEDPVHAGDLRFSNFSTDPKVYVTTVGLYNDSNDLVAVAKLSQPVLKDFQSEILCRVRLDF